MNFSEERKYFGHISQVFDVKEFTYLGGRAKGVRAVEVKNGSGLEFTVIADKGMDIGSLSFKNLNFSFMTCSGLSAPEFYDKDGGEWLRSFTGGFLTTCGLSNIGAACIDNGQELGVHGRISNTPAFDFGVSTDIVDGAPEVTIKGKLSESVIFNENLLVKREIKSRYKEPSFTITDITENMGCRTVPFMHLFHFNFGYPFLTEKTEIVIPAKKTEPKSERAAEGISSWDKTHEPIDAYEEMVYYHTLKRDENGITLVAIYSHEHNMGALLEFNTDSLDHFIEWKNLGTGEYVIGLEPANAKVAGRAAARAENDLKFLKSGDIDVAKIRVSFFEGPDELSKIKAKMDDLK